MSTNQRTDRLVTFKAPVELVKDFQAAVRAREQSLSGALRLHMKEVVADASTEEREAA
jgi:hypothetical protein